MAKKNQSNRLTTQHKESQGVVGIFGDEAKSHDITVGKISHFVIEQLEKEFPQLSFQYRTSIKKEEINDEKVALVRLEQLYPLDNLRINEIFEKYNNRKEFVWAQEEPENMGAWTFLLRNFRNQDIQVIAPVSSGTPAPGTHKKFDKNQKGVINKVFGLATN